VIVRQRLIAFACMLLATSSALAQPVDVDSAPAGLSDAQRYEVGVGARFGVARAPFFTRDFPAVRGHGFTFQAVGAYRLLPSTWLALRVPWIAMSVEQPARSYVDTFSWGNPELTALRQFDSLWHGRGLSLHGSAGAALALPIAQHGPRDSLYALRALRLASAMDALRHQALFTSGVLPISMYGGVVLAHARGTLDLSLRLPLLARVSRAGLPADARVRSVGLTPVLHVGGSAVATRWLTVLLAADTVFDQLAPVRTERHTHETQFALIPGLSFRLIDSLRLQTDFVLPLAGSLAGHVYAGSLQLIFAR
jgi:hypothetical protein